jgi:hypothetical protein
MDDPTDRAASTDDDLARLREQRPAWHIRHASTDQPGALGYIATRGGTLITADNLVRLGDRIAEADRAAAGEDAAPPSPGALLTGAAGWNSGAMPDLTAEDLAAATAPRGWEVTRHPGHFTAEQRLGTMIRVLCSRTVGGLAHKIAAAEAALPAPDPAEVTGALVAQIAAAHPSWAVGAAEEGHGVTAARGDVVLWAYSAAELSALLDVADPEVT